MKHQILVAAAIASLSTAALAAPESYTLDSRHLYPIFEVSHMGLSIQRGRFNKAAAMSCLSISMRRAVAVLPAMPGS